MKVKAKSDTVLTILSPIYYISKVFFVASYTIVKTKEKSAAVSRRKDVFYSLFGFIIYTLMLVYFFANVKSEIGEDIIVPLYVYYVKVCMLFFMMVIFMLCGLTYRHTITDVFKNFDIIDNIFENINIKLNYKKTQTSLLRKLIYVMIASVIKTLLLGVIIHLDPLQFVLLFCVTTARTIVKHQFTLLTTEVKARYAQINTTIETSFLAGETIKAKSNSDLNKIYRTLFILCRIHYKLRKTIHYIINAFSLQLLCYIGLTLTDIIFQSYLLYVIFSADNNVSSFFIVYITVWLYDEIFELYTLVITCSDTANAAAKTATILHKLTNEVKNSELENHVQMYSLQMLHQTIQFSILGFVIIDNALLYSMVGAVTTYLVILIQFNQAQKSVSDTKTEYLNETTLDDNLLVPI